MVSFINSNCFIFQIVGRTIYMFFFKLQWFNFFKVIRFSLNYIQMIYWSQELYLASHHSASHSFIFSHRRTNLIIAKTLQ